MQTDRDASHPLHIRPEALMTLVRSLSGISGAREDDDHGFPPGPWDPIIREGLGHVHQTGPHPEPWHLHSQFSHYHSHVPVHEPSPEPWKHALASLLARHPEMWDAIGGGIRFGDEVSLNPQPLPPRLAVNIGRSYGDEVALNPQPLPPRLRLMMAVAQAVVRHAQLVHEVASAIANEGEQQGIIIVSGYIGRFADEFCATGYKLRFPVPGPRPNWFIGEMTGVDLLVISTQLDQAASEAYDRGVRNAFATGARQFAEAGIARF